MRVVVEIAEYHMHKCKPSLWRPESQAQMGHELTVNALSAQHALLASVALISFITRWCILVEMHCKVP